MKTKGKLNENSVLIMNFNGSADARGRVRLAGYRRRVTYARFISETMESSCIPNPVYIKLVHLYKSLDIHYKC